MNKLTTHNVEWLASPADTMQAFVGAVLVRDRTYAYRSCYANVYEAAQSHDWDGALDAAIALRTYAQRSHDREGEQVARILVACACVALQRHTDALVELGQHLAYPGVLVDAGWHVTLAHSISGVALYANYDTTGALVALQRALLRVQVVNGWAKIDRSPYSLANEAQRRLVYDVQHREFRETLAVALREAIERLAVIV